MHMKAHLPGIEHGTVNTEVLTYCVFRFCNYKTFSLKTSLIYSIAGVVHVNYS